ncbi:TSC22 domain family protein 2 isoform X2 [Dendropsophus ebraccatus]|uniref:TSC22 domain family protein 2 isoform X2 n=1 Tax=Dendropsophus ebraccatus TaxID=150705 RepID=UPI003831F32E
MSKMPAKKKSCFQITSVTTAQAASSITEDTESLDDPDESRTEDVSSEIFDVSRATDYGPEDVVERSSSEETLNNVGDPDSSATVSPNVQHQPEAARIPAPAATPGSTAPLPSAACSSRFRVIKLDHGSGEPYRRGRWTCTEYYDRDSDSTVITRGADSMRERDSGLGATVGSVHAGPGPDSLADASVSAVSQLLHPDKLSQPRQPPPVYPGAQSYAQSGHNGPAPPGAAAGLSMSQQSSAACVSQPQPFSYPQAAGHVMGSGQPVPLIQPQAAGTSLPGQHLPAASGGVMGLHPKPGDPASQGSGLPAPQSHPAHMQQASIGGGQAKGTGSSQLSNIPGGHHAMTPGLHSVPTSGVSGITSSVPSVSATPVTMPIAPSTFVQSPLSSHTSVSRSNSLVPTVGLPPVQGTSSVHSSLPQSTISQFQSQPLAGQIDDRRKSEPLPQPPIPLISEKSFVKVPLTDPLTNPLHLPVFGLPIPVDGEDDSSTSANVVAIDNKIEQAMDLVKSHLMYAVREEVEVLKEQIKELIEKNSTLERENALLKSLSNSDQLSQLSTQVGLGTSQQPPPVTTASHTAPQTAHTPQQPNVSSA